MNIIDTTNTNTDDFTPRLEFRQSCIKPVTATFEGGQISTDCGLLLLQEADVRLGLCSGMARFMEDTRDSRRITYEQVEMVRQRVYGISSGSEDCNDHDTLRRDPIHKLVAGRSPEDADADLASQPTLSRFENKVSKKALLRMAKEMARQVIASLSPDIKSLVIDIDGSEDKVYGNQQLGLFNTHHHSVCFFPLFLHLTDDQGRQYILGSLLRPGAIGQQGTRYLLKAAIRLIRKRFPEMDITVRADAGFGGDKIFKRCESLDVEYLIRFPSNVSLKAAAKKYIDEALFQYHYPAAEFGEENLPAVEYYGAFYWKAKDWQQPRRIIVKTVVTSADNIAQYFAVTSREETPQELFRFYHQRGEQENRIKEIKNDLACDRTSCHRFEANQFRLLLHCAANMLFNNLQHAILEVAPHSKFVKAQICTLQRDLIKAAGRVIERCKRIWVHLSSTCLHRDLWWKLHTWHLSSFG